MILTGLRAVGLIDRDGNGRRGREVGKACDRAAPGRDWAEAASGDETRGREAAGLNGEGAGAATDMTAGEAGGEKHIPSARRERSAKTETYRSLGLWLAGHGQREDGGFLEWVEWILCVGCGERRKVRSGELG